MLSAYLDFYLSERMLERLCVGVGRNKFHATETGANHIVDRVAPTAPDSDHSDDSIAIGIYFKIQHVWEPPNLNPT
jgi:hypothetical protein